MVLEIAGKSVYTSPGQADIVRGCCVHLIEGLGHIEDGNYADLFMVRGGAVINDLDRSNGVYCPGLVDVFHCYCIF